MIAATPATASYPVASFLKPSSQDCSKIAAAAALPVEWTRGENILLRYPAAIIVNNKNNRKIIDEESNEPPVASRSGCTYRAFFFYRKGLTVSQSSQFLPAPLHFLSQQP